MYTRFERVSAALIFVSALLGLATGAMAQTKPVPLINQPLVPDAVAPGGPTFTLTVNGTGFVSKSRVYWNGSKKTTTFVSKSQLTALISSADIATAGTASVMVADPALIEGTSNVAFVSITNSTANVGFNPTSIYQAGSESGVAVGDFNGDGKLDLAVANYEIDGTVSILLGDGAGNFTLASTSATGSFPHSIAVGDFNGDGKLDLAVVNFGDDTVSILLGDGTGNFTLVSSPAVGSSPESVAVGDFNGDGNLDLAVANYQSGTVSILLGDGTGDFTLASSPATGFGPESVAVGDFNGDGKLDVAVVTERNNSVSILLGDGTGNFTLGSSVPAGASPVAIVTADFNGDGKLDLAVANDTSDTLSILLGDGMGNFTLVSSPETGGRPDSIAVGDFNGDGKLDLAVSNGASFDISVLLGDGTGNFTQASSPATAGGYSPFSVAVGDFNSDGKPDLAVVTNQLSIFLQAPAVTLSPGDLSFSRQKIGTSSAPQTVTVTNAGYAAVNISGVTLTGSNPEYFSETNNCPSSLAVGASCTITVKFSPIDGGTYTATLSVSDDGGNNPPSISITGVGLSAEVSPKRLNFGDAMVGQTSRPMFSTLTNVGPTTLDIYGLFLVGKDPGDFSVGGTCYEFPTPPRHPTMIPPGGTCTVKVYFNPTQTGSRTATVNINDNGGGPTIKLSGTGT